MGSGMGSGKASGLEASLSHRGVCCSLRCADALIGGERGGLRERGGLLCRERDGDGRRGGLSKLGLGLGTGSGSHDRLAARCLHGGLPCGLAWPALLAQPARLSRRPSSCWPSSAWPHQRRRADLAHHLIARDAPPPSPPAFQPAESERCVRCSSPRRMRKQLRTSFATAAAHPASREPAVNHVQ